MANSGLTNTQIVKALELPDTIITQLQTAQGKAFEAVSNQFLDALFNKVVYQTVSSLDFTNPFKAYDSFPINYGDTIENIFVELPKGYKFNKDATDPFTKAKPSIKTLYATINYEMQYETTIEDALLRRACLNEYGFMNLIETILGSLTKGMSIDEYFATIGMLNNASIYADGFETIDAGSTDKETAEIVAKKIIDVSSNFKFPNKKNNAYKTVNVASFDNTLLIIKQTLLNTINLDYLAGVYNLSKVELLKKIITVESFKITNAEGTEVGEDLDFIILDTKGFDNHTALQDGGMIYNPKGKYTNHYTNLWKIISYKYFYNARAFKLNPVVQTAMTSENALNAEPNTASTTEEVKTETTESK